jgi:transcriptional regulator with XRE-family HTH domain
MKKSTDELLNILKSKKSYDDFLKQEINELYFESISEYLEMLISQKGLKKADIIKKANLDKNYAYQIFNGNKTNPSRDKLIMLAFGMQLSLDETEKLLKISNVSELYVRSPRDSAIIFCLERKMDLIETNEKLDELSLPILE